MESKWAIFPRQSATRDANSQPPEMSYLSVKRVTAPSYLIWLSYHLLRRCQLCFFYCSEPLSTQRRFSRQKKKRLGGGAHFAPIQGATLKNKCYAIKRGLLNRSVYLYGNNDRLKTLGSMTCRTRERICMQLLCEHDSPNDLVKLPCSKKWVGYFSGVPLCIIHFPFPFKIEQKPKLTSVPHLVWSFWIICGLELIWPPKLNQFTRKSKWQITFQKSLKSCCHGDP